MLVLLLSTLPGLALGWLCSLSFIPLARLFRLFANVVKVIPPILLLIVLYFAVFPLLGLESMSALAVAGISLGLAFMPLQAEAFRLLFDRTQKPADRTGYAEFVRALSGNFALMIRDSSLASLIAVPELFKAGQKVAAETYEIFLPYTFMLVFYLGVGLLVIYLGKVLAWSLLKAGK
ncbi:hypothetical protein D9M73_186660 [compost metagenome]